MDDPDIVERLRNYNTCSDTDVDEAADEIERLRKERDEARRVVCMYEAYRLSQFSQSPPCAANQVANRRGWDCFKEKA